MNRPFRFLATLGLALIAGCGGAVDAEPAGAPRAVLTAPPGGNSSASRNLLPLLRSMSTAPTTVSHSGVRRVEQYWTVDGEPRELRYREQVASDGAGQFAIDAIELIAPVTSPQQVALFLVLQKAREGFVRRYRDFAVRDVDSFVRNYSIIDLGTLVTVAGRPCNEYLVQRVVGDSVRYLIAVDAQTALVLRARHEDSTGALLSLVEFESVDLAPNHANVAWHQPLTDELALPTDPALVRTRLGFAPRLPRTDGGLFVLQSATSIEAPNPTGAGTLMWAKHTLTDGVEVVFFLHGGPDPAPKRDDIVLVAPSVGPWNTAEGSLRGELYTAMGRIAVAELLDLFEATL